MTLPCFAGVDGTTELLRTERATWDALDDEEGDVVPGHLPPVIDAHVHLFPPSLFAAIWNWFDTNAWPIRYRQRSEEVLASHRARGIEHMIGLCYAHKPGISEGLNSYMADLVERNSDLTGLATVHPDDVAQEQILQAAFARGLSGVKLHCHVQVMGPNDPRLHPTYRACADAGKSVVIHAGRQPRSSAYKRDPIEFCHVDHLESVLKAYPDLKICVPHLGADEEEAYAALLSRYDNLWLDTTMMLAGYFPDVMMKLAIETRPDRVMYGTDYPNLPYAWDRELRRLDGMGLPENILRQVLADNAREFFALS